MCKDLFASILLEDYFLTTQLLTFPQALFLKKKKTKKKLTTCFKILENHFYNPLAYPLFSPGTLIFALVYGLYQDFLKYLFLPNTPESFCVTILCVFPGFFLTYK